MHKVIVALLVLAVTAGCEQADTDEEEPAPPDTTVAETAPTPPPGPTVVDTVEAGKEFKLVWHNRKACIEIDPDVVPAGTVITIELVGDVAPGLQQQADQAGYPTVLPPVYEFSAEPEFVIEDSVDMYTMGICANTGPGNPLLQDGAAIARFGDTFEALEWADEPDCLACPNGESARASSNSLLSGSFLDPTPLHAAPLVLQGIGGRGTALSPFAVVEPEQQQ